MLIEDLLILSRATRATMYLQTVDLGAEVDDIAGQLQREEPGRDVRFIIQRPVPARADPALIRTVLRNLLENAWKFTSHRDNGLIEFGTTPTGDASVCCYVRDNGAGFDPQNVDKLFEPFQRLHSPSEFPGTGIGLASVRQIVERHGGRAWAEGSVGVGAAIYFTLNAEKLRQPDGVAGPAGPAGQAGKTGAAGAAGQAGETGAAGAAGRPGRPVPLGRPGCRTGRSYRTDRSHWGDRSCRTDRGHWGDRRRGSCRTDRSCGGRRTDQGRQGHRARLSVSSSPFNHCLGRVPILQDQQAIEESSLDGALRSIRVKLRARAIDVQLDGAKREQSRLLQVNKTGLLSSVIGRALSDSQAYSPINQDLTASLRPQVGRYSNWVQQRTRSMAILVRRPHWCQSAQFLASRSPLIATDQMVADRWQVLA